MARKTDRAQKSIETVTHKFQPLRAQTCKRMKRHVLGYLTEAVRCHRRQAPVPSLLPPDT